MAFSLNILTTKHQIFLVCFLFAASSFTPFSDTNKTIQGCFLPPLPANLSFPPLQRNRVYTLNTCYFFTTVEIFALFCSSLQRKSYFENTLTFTNYCLLRLRTSTSYLNGVDRSYLDPCTWPAWSTHC